MNDPRLSDSADRTHRVFWGSHGCCLPYRHVGPCVCDCALIAVEEDEGARMVVTIDASDWWTPEPETYVHGEDVLGPPAPAGVGPWCPAWERA